MFDSFYLCSKVKYENVIYHIYERSKWKNMSDSGNINLKFFQFFFIFTHFPKLKICMIFLPVSVHLLFLFCPQSSFSQTWRPFLKCLPIISEMNWIKDVLDAKNKGNKIGLVLCNNHIELRLKFTFKFKLNNLE